MKGGILLAKHMDIGRETKDLDFSVQKISNDLANIHNVIGEIIKIERWGNLDLNQGPTGYEGGGPPYNPIPSNRYEYDGKGFLIKMLLEFIGF